LPNWSLPEIGKAYGPRARRTSLGGVGAGRPF